MPDIKNTYTLGELARTFEEHNHQMTKAQLKTTFGASAIRKMKQHSLIQFMPSKTYDHYNALDLPPYVKKPAPEQPYYKLTQNVYKKIHKLTSEGYWRLDRNTFISWPQEKIAWTEMEAKTYVERQLSQRAVKEGLLIKAHHVEGNIKNGFSYEKIEFYPARYQRLNNNDLTLKFDFVRHENNPAGLTHNAKINEGQGNYLKKLYYQQLKNTPPEGAFEGIVNQVTEALQKQQNGPLITVKQLYRRMTSIAFRSLPVVGAVVAYNNVANSEDKYNTAVNEVTQMAGAVTAGGIAGIYFGPLGVVAGGVLGAVGADKAHEAMVNRLEITPPHEEAAVIPTYDFYLEGRDYSDKPVSGLSTLHDTSFLSTYGENLNYHAINAFIEGYYESPFKSTLSTGNPNQAYSASSKMTDAINAPWYASNKANTPINHLTNQLGFLDYVTKNHAYFLTPEGKHELVEAQRALRQDLTHYTPQGKELKQYRVLQDRLASLEQFSHYLTRPKEKLLEQVSPEFQVILKEAKTPEALVTKAKQQAYDYSTDAFSEYLNDNFDLKLDDIHLEKDLTNRAASLEAAEYWENSGKVSLELSRLAHAVGNHNLGKALVVSGALAQGIGAAMLIKGATTGAALGHVGAMIGAVATLASTVLADDSENGLGEALQEIMQQIGLLRQELQALRQFMAEFRTELFERLSIYFDALESLLLYQEEMIRNGHSRASYEATLSRAGINAILSQLKDDIIYQARAYHEGIIDVNYLKQERAEELLPRLRLLLDKSAAAYDSGVSLFEAQEQHRMLASSADIHAMINDPIKRGQLFGYLACYYQRNNWTTHLNMTIQAGQIINPLQWNEVVKPYLYLRQAPITQTYDAKYKELNLVKQQGVDYVDFVNGLRASIPITLETMFDELLSTVHATIHLFQYPKAARALVKKYSVSQEVEAILHRHDSSGRTTIQLPEEFFSLEAAGFGSFSFSNAACHRRYLFRDQFGGILRRSGPPPHISPLHSFRQSNAINFTYRDGYNNHTVPVATTLPIGWWFGDDGSWSHDCSMHYHAEFAPEVKASHRRLKQNYTSERIVALDKNLVPNCEKIQELILHIKAILSAAGVHESILAALPMITFPNELSSWIADFRADLLHEDSYKPFPNANSQIEQLNYYAESIEVFQEHLFELIENNTLNKMFSSPEIATISSRLKDLSQLQTKLLFSHNVSHEPASNDWVSMMKSLMQQHEAIPKRADKIEPKPTYLNVSSILSDPAWTCTRGLSSNEKTCVDSNNQYHEIMITRLFGSWDDFSPQINACTEESNVKYCHGDEVEYTEYLPTETSSSTTQIIGRAACTGALSSVLPEAIGDASHLSGLVSETASTHIKLAVNLMLIALVSDGWKSWFVNALVAYGTHRLLQEAGCPELFARPAANAMAFLAGTRGDITPINVAAAVVSHASGQLGFWAEKAVVRQIQSTTRTREVEDEFAPN